MTQATLSVYNGETLAFELEYTGNDGNPVPNLTDATAEMRFSSEEPAVSGTVDPATGVLAFEVASSQTENWPTSGLQFQVWLAYASGKSEMVVSGNIDVQKAF